MPPWAPERVATLSPEERAALYARMEEARQRFIESHPVIIQTLNNEPVEASTLSTISLENQTQPVEDHAKPPVSETQLEHLHKSPDDNQIQQRQRPPESRTEAAVPNSSAPQPVQSSIPFQQPSRFSQIPQASLRRMASVDLESDADSYHTAGSDNETDYTTVPSTENAYPSAGLQNSESITSTTKPSSLEFVTKWPTISVPLNHSPNDSLSHHYVSNSGDNPSQTAQSTTSTTHVSHTPNLINSTIPQFSPVDANNRHPPAQLSYSERPVKEQAQTPLFDQTLSPVEGTLHVLTINDIDGNVVDNNREHISSLTNGSNASTNHELERFARTSSPEIATIDLDDAFDDNINDSWRTLKAGGVDANPQHALNTLESTTSCRQMPMSPDKPPGKDFVAKDALQCNDCLAWRCRVQELETQVEALHAAIVAREMEITSLRARLENGPVHSSKNEARLLQECKGLRLTVEFLVSPLTTLLICVISNLTFQTTSPIYLSLLTIIVC